MPGINIGIDLGTATVQYYVDGKGIVLTEDVATASDSKTGRTVSVGSKAYKMIGRTPDSITVHRPLRDGIVSDFTAAQDLLRYNLQKICGNRIFKPNLVLCVPTDVTGLEKRVLLNIATASGAAKACLIEKPIAAALGAGVDYRKPRGTMVVDIGAGSTEIAVITMGSIAIGECIHVAGNTFDDDIARYLRRERAITIGKLSAEQIKKKVGCAYLREAEIAISVKGKSYITGMPMLFEITTTEVFLALREHLEQIADTVRSVLSQTPPELLADISENGIILTGGSARLPGIERIIERKIHVPTRVAQEPENCVVRGIGIALNHMDILSDNGYFFKTRQDIENV
ncbi:MAG: rod shape-determining protein [Oscillospiraceae bacterium]|nr:rod shape-determining protein [Oscillospiraceae bacterium]